MRIDQVVMTISRKHNLGDYENVDFSLTITLTPEPGDRMNECLAKAWEEIQNELYLAKRRFDERGKLSDEELSKQAERLVAEAMEEK